MVQINYLPPEPMTENDGIIDYTNQTTSDLTPKINHEDAQRRAYLYNQLFGEDENVAFSHIVAGREVMLRDKVSAKLDNDSARAQLEAINQISMSPDMSPEEQREALIGLSVQRLTNPENVLEVHMAEQLIADAYMIPPNADEMVQEQAAVNRSTAEIFLGVAQENLAKQSVVHNRLEDLMDERFGVWNYIEQLVPFRSWALISNSAEDHTPVGGGLLGDNLRQQVEYLYSLPLDEFTSTFNSVFNDIVRSNASDALLFAEAVLAFSSSMQVWSNISSGIDIASLPGVGIVGRAAGRVIAGAPPPSFIAPLVPEVREVSTAMADLVAANARKNPTETLAAAGQVGDAALITVQREINQNANLASTAPDLGPKLGLVPQQESENLRTLFDIVPTFMNSARVITGGATRLSGEYARRLLTKIEEITSYAGRALTDLNQIERLSGAAQQAAIDSARSALQNEFKHINDSIIDIQEVVKSENSLANVRTLEMSLAKPDASLFNSSAQAQHWASKVYELPEYEIRQQGSKFYITVDRQVAETDNSVLDALIETGNTTPDSWANKVLGTLRSAEDLLPVEQRQARARVTSATQELFNTYSMMAKPIQSLSGRAKKRFRRFLESSVGQQNRLFDTLGEFEEAWINVNKRAPSLAEATAYFSYKKIHELNYVFKNLSVYSEKVRRGLRNFQVKGVNDELSPQFEGKILNDFDLDKLGDNTTIAVIDDDGTPIILTKASLDREIMDDYLSEALRPRSNKVTGTIYKAPNGKFVSKIELQGIINSRNRASQVIKVDNPAARPLSKVIDSNQVVDYVITARYQDRRLQFRQVDFNPKGDFVPEYTSYVKQPKAQIINGRKIYFGDQVLQAGKTSRSAQAIAKIYEQARALFNAKKFDEFNALVKQELSMTPKQLKEAFEKGTIDPNQPIIATKQGSRTISYANIREQLKDFEDAEANNVEKQIIGTRGFNEYVTEKLGEETAPLFEIKSARTLDPLSHMARAVSSIARNRYFNDYRIKAANHFVEEFSDVLEGSKDRMRLNPIATLYNPRWSTNPNDLGRQLIAKNFQRATTDLLGVMTPIQRVSHLIKERMYDTISDKLGEGIAERVDDLFTWAILDPVKSMRAIAFHAKLGLFHIVQLFKQAQTMAIVAAVTTPDVFAKAFPTYFLSRGLMLSAETPQIISKFAEVATKFGWKKEHFQEAYENLRQTGLLRIQGEHVWTGDILDPKMITNRAGRWLDKGTFFFREGERTHRIVGYMSSYLEWRKANPHSPFNRKAQDSVLLRARQMSVNMTKESNAAWQKGFLNIPTQFLTYQIRLWELMLGKRITRAQKARLMLMQSALYGVPIGVGGTVLGVWPVYDEFRQELLKRGEEPAQGFEAFLHEGITGLFGRLITGEDTTLNESLGPSGLDIIKDFLSGESSAIELLFGVSGSTLGSLLSSSYPILEDMKAMVSGGTSGDFNVLLSDLQDVVRNVSTLDAGIRAYFGLTVGKYFARNDQEQAILNDINTAESILIPLLGSLPQEISDMRLMTSAMRSQNSAQDEAKRQIIRYYRRWMQTDDPETQQAYFNRIQTWFLMGDFTPQQQGQIFAEAIQGYESVFAQVNERFMRTAPMSEVGARQEEYYNGAEERR